MLKTDPQLVVEFEKKLLAALFIRSGEAIPDAAEMLEPDDFSRPEHRLVFKALVQLSAENVPVDLLLVEQAMRKSGDLEEATRRYLHNLIAFEFSNRRVPEYAKAIKEASTLRRLEELGQYISYAARDAQTSLAELVSKTEQTLTALTKVEDKHEPVPIVEAAVNYFNQLQEKKKGDTGIKTGFWNIDSLVGSFNKSDLIILAARPSMGKSALALNIAANVAKKYSVLLFSLEMSMNQVVNRLYAADSGVAATKIQYKSYNSDEADDLVDSVDRLGKLKLYLDDSASLSLMALKLKAQRVKKRYKLDFIVVDYLQLMAGSGKYRDNRVQEVSELSRGLKALARDLDIPILALSQLSRQVELRADKRPILSDLRESGSIEQDADIVMFLYRDEYYNRDDEDNKNRAEIIVAKNRNGMTGIRPLHWDKMIQKFSDLTVKG